MGHLFQGRYKAFLVQEDPYLLGLVRYIHENPVRARVAKRARDYLWSSDRYYRKGDGPAWLDVDEVLAMLGGGKRATVRAYVELMARGQGASYEDLESVGQVIKGEEEFALRRFAEAGEIQPRLLGLSEGRLAMAVAAALKLRLEDLRGPGRTRSLSEARAMSGYLGKRLGGISWSRMARYFHRDGSTLTRDVGRLEQGLAKDPVKRRRLTSIAKALRPSAR